MVSPLAALSALGRVAAVSDVFADEADRLAAELAAAVLARRVDPAADVGPALTAAVDRARFFAARLATWPGPHRAAMADLYADLTHGSA
jgi:hypothetical protein